MEGTYCKPGDDITVNAWLFAVCIRGADFGNIEYWGSPSNGTAWSAMRPKSFLAIPFLETCSIDCPPDACAARQVTLCS